MSNEREDGFYRVKHCGKWTIAEWGCFGNWYLSGVDSSFPDSEFDEIDERRIEVDE